MSAISRWILKLLGWKITGIVPNHIPKCIIIVVPHTSNWDFPLGLLVRSASQFKSNFIGKSSLFTWPFGYIFKALGGIPVDRSKSNNFVDSVVQVYKEREEIKVAIAPEGTRKKANRLKTGFYYIALGAEIPIVMVKFDYKHKEVNFAPEFYPSGDKEKDFKVINDHFKGVEGKIKSYSYGL